MSEPQIINTVTGDDGHVKSYVSVRDVIAFEGPLLALPVVSTNDTGYISVSDASATFNGQINGVSYTVGEVITFVTTAVLEAYRTNTVDVEIETASRMQTTSFAIAQRPAEPGTVTH